MATDPAQELVDILDEEGRPVAVMTRREMRGKRLPHRCVYLLVFNRRGELFIHQRTPTKDVYPSYWDVAVGGVLAAGESYDGAAVREAGEEIGVELKPDPLFPFRYADAASVAHGMVYRAVHDGPFRLQPEEVVRGEFVPVAEALARIGREPFCPDGVQVLNEYLGRTPLDLDAYLRRVGYAGDLHPTRETLEALHLAHATSIPFENLDIHLGRPIRLDLGSLQAKLVHGRRGGYCFEQNTLFAAVLSRIGFRVTPLAARVRLDRSRVSPRTHMLLRVEVEGRPWIADVGFGYQGLMLPVPLEAGAESEQFAWTYRLDEEPGGWALRLRQGDGWLDLYVFTTEPQESIDYEVANYFVSTCPESHFVQTLTAQSSTPEARHVLRGWEYAVTRADGTNSRAIGDDEELLHLLAEQFRLSFPAGTRFRPPAARKC